jgi:hypothetical protein
MLTKLFNSNSIFSFFILIIITFVLWAKVFMNDVPMSAPVQASPLYNALFRNLGEFSIVCSFIAIAFLFFEALLANYMLSENDLIPRNSYIAAFIYVIISGFFADIIILNPVLMANIFIIAAIWLFLKLYEEHEAYATVFNIGMLTSVASMFYFPSAVFILLIWIGFVLYRMFSWREWFISILGFLFPYIFLASYYYWNDCLIIKISEYKQALHFINFFDFSPTMYVYIIIAVLGLLLFISVLKLLFIINEKSIRIRKFLLLFIWTLIICFVSLNLSAEYGILGFVMLLLPVSVFFTLYMSFIKRARLAEYILFILILLLASGRLGLWSLS